MPEPRFFSPAEARAAIPTLRPLLAELRGAFHEYRFAREQVDELREAYGEDPADVAGHPAADEAKHWHFTAEQHAQRVEALASRIRASGCDVKDPLLGLIDFPHRREDGQVVLLCYRDDEDTIRFWHPVETGFAGRRPLEEL